MKKNEGFTMIELIVVMAIISILIGLGVEGLIRFKGYTELQESGKQSITLLNLLKNSAKNDVRDPTDTRYYPYTDVYFRGYKFSFESSNGRYVEACETNAVAATNQWTCIFNQETQNALLSQTPVKIQAGSDQRLVANVPQCSGIYFESLTGDILIATKATPTQVRQARCFLPFTDANQRYTNYLFVDGIVDNFSIYKTPEEVESAFNY